jgi:hypothetical protein
LIKPSSGLQRLNAMASTFMDMPENRRARWTQVNWPDDLQAAGLEFAGTAAFLLIALGGVQAAAAAIPADPVQAALIRVAQVTYISTVFGKLFVPHTTSHKHELMGWQALVCWSPRGFFSVVRHHCNFL